MLCPDVLTAKSGMDQGLQRNQDSAPDIESSDTLGAPTPLLTTETSTTVPQPPPVGRDRRPGWRVFVAPAWFLLGVLVGLVGFALYAQYVATPAPAQTLDEATVRRAAREGLIEAIQSLQSGAGQGQASQSPQTVSKDSFAVRAANRLGDPNAKVTIVEYADFQCPFCGRHHQSVTPTLLAKYVETGKANYVYKHMAFLGPESVYAAVASECAADQGKFWEYHDYLFEHQAGENQGAFAKDSLVAFGQALGLEMTKFEECLQSDQTIGRVKQDTEEAQGFGVNSTPTFFINGKPLVGLAPPEEFSRAVDQALEE
jgi:protein-disulfide isomerase